MGRVKILAVAVACLASAAFAGGDLWDFPNILSATNCGDYCGQVKTPGALYCWQAAERPSLENSYFSPCYKQSGGWWFGYADNGGAIKDAVSSYNVFLPKGNADSCTTNQPPDKSIGNIVVEKWIDPGTKKENIDWIPHTVTGSVTAQGHYYIKGYGLGAANKDDGGFDVSFVNGAGTDEDPSVSGFGFNWRAKAECGNTDYEGPSTENISAKGTGLCIVYKADKAGVDVELGWNEAVYDYNTWVVRLPVATSWTTMDMLWDDFSLSYESDEFEPKQTAITKAEALKFAFKNKTSTTSTIRFQLKEVGWAGSCSGTAIRPPAQTPIIGGKMASPHKFSISGRTLSANFAGTVQVINLQGVVVAKKALAANESMSLANLPAGVYMVRSTNPGIVQKIIVK